MTRSRGAPLLTCALAVAALVPPAAAQSPAAEVAEQRVVFVVDNVNRSDVACAADGQRYELEATIVGPAALLGESALPAAVLYVHGLGLTSAYWHFQAVPEHSHAAQMARRGHVSVVYDRLGYGSGPKPQGMQSCYGSDADIAAQLVGLLKAGDYRTESGSPMTFDRVAVAAHSQAGLIVQPMAYSFDAAEAIVLTSWTDEGNRPAVAVEAAKTAQDCAASVLDPEADDFYARFPREDTVFRDLYFHAADERVVAAATALREPDPCGQGASLPATLAADSIGIPTVDEPVLLVYGEHDGYRSADAGRSHAARFTGSDDVTVQVLPGAGNAFVLEPAAAPFQALLATWLCERALAAPSACAPAAAPAAGPAAPPVQSSPSGAGPSAAGPSAVPAQLPVTGPPGSAVVALLLLAAAGGGVLLARRGAPQRT